MTRRQEALAATVSPEAEGSEEEEEDLGADFDRLTANNQANGGVSPSEEAGDGQTSYAIKGLLGRRIGDDGITVEYEVDWEQEGSEPSWEPWSNIDPVAIRTYQARTQTQPDARGRGRGGRGRPPGRGGRGGRRGRSSGRRGTAT